MARKVVNIKELREESEAAEKADDGKKKAPKKKAAKRPSRAKKKTAADLRMRLFWGVFNQSMKRVALYEFNQKRAADKKASELTESSKGPHFVQRVKEMIEE